MSLKQELKKARNRAGLTQQDVAVMTNIALGTLRRWEQGVNEPDTESLVALLDLYGASADEVLGSDFYAKAAARLQHHLGLCAWMISCRSCISQALFAHFMHSVQLVLSHLGRGRDYAKRKKAPRP